MGYIAMNIALVGKGERDAGYRAYDIAFEHFHMSHVSFLLLIKVSHAMVIVPQLLILLRLSSSLWPESTTMRYLA